ncbi:uncharacterized protein LOC129219372 [Uloborus diversus]|uniref:uncharacterized protein LOC129219372 n=1 Tax=Uloborus diversus TaxID=327109 RepID=UPI00240A3AE6|nr:uncharacterized protein LOC129219372 [Uloborus diversus]
MSVLSDNHPLTHNILGCHHHFQNLATLKKSIVFQWVLAHCGVPSNEIADYLAKKGALVAQSIPHRKHLFRIGVVPAHCGVPGNEIADYLTKKGALVKHLRKHHFRIEVLPCPSCNLSGSGEDTDRAHLLHCTALCKTSLAEKHWEPRDNMD